MALLDTLIAYWKLEEASGTRADSHGTSPLTSVNSVGSTTGKIGTAAAFVRASGTYLENAGTAVDLTATDSWSVSFWYYPTAFTDYAVILSNGAAGAGKQTFLTPPTTGRLWRWSTYDSGVNLSLNVWTHIVYTFTSGGTDTGTEQFYINGVATASRTGAVPAPQTAYFRFGSVSGGVDTITGYLDEIGYWRRALTSTEVTELYGGGAGLAYPFGAVIGTVAWPATSTFAVVGMVQVAGTVGWVAGSSFAVSGVVQIQGTVTWAPASALLTDLVAYWALDEASGTRNDSHGTNHLSDNNTVTQGTGKISTAAQFTAANSEYLSHASNASLVMGDIDFTIAAWFNTVGFLEAQIVAKDSEAGRDYALDLSGPTLRFYIQGGSVLVSAGDLVGPSAWHFVVAWHDSVNNQLGIVVNDGTVATVSTSGLAPGTSSTEFRIGARQYSGFEGYFDGLIDEVGIWKRMLTPAERTALYNGGTGLTYAGFLGGVSAQWSVSGQVVIAATVAWASSSTFAVSFSVRAVGTVAWSATSTWVVTGQAFTGVAVLWTATSAWAVQPTIVISATVSWAHLLLTDLTAYWTLDEASGTRGDSHDDIDLVDNNTVTSATGKVGSAAHFDATNSEFLSYPHNAALALDTDQPFTVAGWVSIEDATGVRSLIARWDVSNREWSLSFVEAAGLFLFRFQVTADPNAATAANADHYLAGNPTGEWHFVCGWHDPDANTVNIQVDGGAVSSVAWAGGTRTGTSSLNLGAWSSGTARHLTGRLDEFGFWKRVLTAAERTALWADGAGQTYPLTKPSATWSVSGTIVWAGTVTWPATPTWTVSGAVGQFGTVAWVASATWNVTGGFQFSGTVTWVANSTWTVSGQLRFAGVIAWVGSSTWAVAVTLIQPTWSGIVVWAVQARWFVIALSVPPRPPQLTVGFSLPDWGQQYILAEMEEDKERAREGATGRAERPGMPVAAGDWGDEIMRRRLEFPDEEDL